MGIKFHFVFSKAQRKGIFLSILMIVALQGIYFFVASSPADISNDRKLISEMNKEVESLRLAERRAIQSKVTFFNPNSIDDYKGSLLGMTNAEIDRLHAFREQGHWIRSAKQFQEVTKIPDTTLLKIAPQFKFPRWTLNLHKKAYVKSASKSKPKTFREKRDLNKATARELQEINGIGKVLSKRIEAFRNTFPGGFIADVQLHDVRGLTSEVINRIIQEFTVKTPRRIRKINLNNATVDALVTIQHIDYDLAHRIVEKRQLLGGYTSLDDLRKVKAFPIDKIDIIKLYLYVD